MKLQKDFFLFQGEKSSEKSGDKNCKVEKRACMQTKPAQCDISVDRSDDQKTESCEGVNFFQFPDQSFDSGADGGKVLTEYTQQIRSKQEQKQPRSGEA